MNTGLRKVFPVAFMLMFFTSNLIMPRQAFAALSPEAENIYTGSISNPLISGESIVLLRHDGAGLSNTPTEINSVTMTSPTTFTYTDVVTTNIVYSYQWAKVNIFGQVQPFADFRVYNVTAPTVTLVQDANNDGYIEPSENPSSSVFTYEISIPSRALVNDSILVDPGSGTIQTITLTSSDITNGSITINTSAPTDGSITQLTAKLQNTSSIGIPTNSTTLNGTDSARMKLSTFVTVSAPDNTTLATPVITGNTDANIGVSVEVVDAGGASQTVTTTADASGNWSIIPTIPLSEGVYTAMATVTDIVGNTATESDSGSVLKSKSQSSSTTGNGGGYDPDREPDVAYTGSVLQDVWNATMAVNVVNSIPAQTEKAENLQNSLLDSQCSALVENVDDLKVKALYYTLFVHNSSDEYVNQYITFGQFSRVLAKYESLLSTIPSEEESVGTILKTIHKAMNDSVERSIAMKVFVTYLQKRYSTSEFVTSTPEEEDITTFADNSPSSGMAPHVQKAYDLCLVHGRKTRDGEPLDVYGNIDRSAPRYFEPNSYITIAETIKVLVNMSYSWDRIEELTGREE